MIFFATERLVVRNWREGDLATLHSIYNDPELMRFFPRRIPLDECRERLARWKATGEERGYCFAPLVLRDEGDAGMIGFAGMLEISQHSLPRCGEHEIGWMIATDHQRRGFASEAARGWIDHARHTFGIRRLNAFTAAVNLPSRAVTRSVGMSEVEGGEFDHPNIDAGPLRRHVLYDITRS